VSELAKAGQDVVEARPAAQALDKPSCLGRMAAMGVAGLGVLYLLNPGAGFFELIPDNMPMFGNLDEAGATAAVIFALRTLFRRKPTKP